jgi:hypothetical protein
MFLSHSLLVDNHMYRHIRNGRWAISLSHIHTHTSMNVCSFGFNFSLFLLWSILSFFLSSTYIHTHKEKERYGGNYWRIIECWHIFLISCLLMLLLERDRFMQHCCVYKCDMNDRTYEHSQPIATNTRHNVVVV